MMILNVEPKYQNVEEKQHRVESEVYGLRATKAISKPKVEE